MTTLLVILSLILIVPYMSRQAKKDNPSQLFYAIQGLNEVDISAIEPINTYPSKKQVKKSKKQAKKQNKRMRNMIYTHAALKDINKFMK